MIFDQSIESSLSFFKPDVELWSASEASIPQNKGGLLGDSSPNDEKGFSCVCIPWCGHQDLNHCFSIIFLYVYPLVRPTEFEL